MVKKRIIVYLMLFSFIVSAYLASSWFFGSVTANVVNEISNDEVGSIAAKNIETDVEKVESGNEITGNLIYTNDVLKYSIGKEEETQSSSTAAKVKVSVEVVG